MTSQNNDQSSNAGAIPMRQVGNTPRYIAAATTTLVKTGSGTLSQLNVNTGGAGSIATIYDGLTAAGTVMAIVDTATRGVLPLNVNFVTGLCVVTSGGSPANLTFTYQ